jgi:acyl-CoA synthetase (AMP-forming)/AMP-acid ligase II
MADWNIAGALRKRAEEQKAQVALVTGKNGNYRQWTFGQLQGKSDDYAGALHRKGIKRGDRVMLMVRPSMEFICLTFALFQLGAVVILIDPGMGYRNLLRCIGSVKPTGLIAIPQVQIFSRFFKKPFSTVRTRICVGKTFGVLGTSLQRACSVKAGSVPSVLADKNDLAAIIFTTGSTGPPKGVQYSHETFNAQLGLIREYYGIGAQDVDQPGFPLFALFATALGATAVIPDMDPTRPAKVNPAKFVRSILDWKVTYSFGSPAIWNVVSSYCLENGITLPVKKILMAGAPVSGELITRVKQIMSSGGVIHTPYGATESLPLTSITGDEILEDTWKLTKQGRGACVGRPLPGMEVAVIRPEEGAVNYWEDAVLLAPEEIGEIVAKGPVVTRAYDHNEMETRKAKIKDGDAIWHRMGDMGYLDHAGRLWFCGRKAHRVVSDNGVMYTICCEAIFNEHPLVARSALVGLGQTGKHIPVLIVELYAKTINEKKLFKELAALAAGSELTRTITTFLVHASFPVDIRHNAKIFREKLAVWASKELKLDRCGQGL